MNKMGGALTLSSTSSIVKSLPSPRELLHVRMLLLLVTRARIVHLGEMETELNCDSGPTLGFSSRAVSASNNSKTSTVLKYKKTNKRSFS